MKKVLKWGGIAFIALIVIAVIAGSGGNKSSNQPSGESNSMTSSNSKQQETAKTYGLNETVQDGDLAFTVTNVTTVKTLGNQFTKKVLRERFML